MCSFNAGRNWIALPFLLLGLASCSSLPQAVVTGIDVQTVQYTDKVVNTAAVKQAANVQTIVYLKGRIGNRAPLLGGMAYELQDATGSIWVLAREPVPNSGDEVIIKGKVQFQSIRLNGVEQGSVYIEQQQQLQHTPAVKT